MSLAVAQLVDRASARSRSGSRSRTSCRRVSVTSTVLSLVLQVDRLDLRRGRAASRNVAVGRRRLWFARGEISFWAKNASTTTIRIGNAALLKNRLMRVRSARPRPSEQSRGAVKPTRGIAEPMQAVRATRSSGCTRRLARDSHRLRRPTRRRRAGCGSARRGPGRSRSRIGRGSRSRRSAIGSSTLRRSGLVSSAQTSSDAGSRAPRLRSRYCSVRPGVDDVLDDQHVAALDRRVEVLEDPHDAAGVGRRAVGRHGHEVDLARDLDVAHEVGQEEDGALEHADQQQVAAGVVAGDLLRRARARAA